MYKILCLIISCCFYNAVHAVNDYRIYQECVGQANDDQSSKEEKEIAIILDRYRSYLFETSQDTDIDSLLLNLDEKGMWKSLDYKDTEPSKWQLSKHLENIRMIALAWSDPESNFYHQKSVWNNICLSLDVWLQNKYKCSNWWHNQIGVPRIMRDIVVLLKDSMDENRWKQSLSILSQLNVLKTGAGANLIWSADLGFHYALLTNNMELAEHCYRLLIEEIRIVQKPDGIMPDCSFQQHGPRLQMYQYGEAYFVESARIAWQVRGTRWAYPKEKIDILSDFVLNGWQWMARGVNTVPGTMDRSATRTGELKAADIRYLIPFLCELIPEKKQTYQKMMDIQNGKGYLEGFRSYPYSDFVAYHHKNLSFFLKTVSTRTLPTESINAENLKGHLLNSGDSYIMRNGNEYYNMMPVWDWEMLPGITNFSESDKIERKPFSGSVDNAESGMAVMDYSLIGKDVTQKITAKKLWACHKGTIVCMIADLTAAHISSGIVTILDQTRLQGKVFYNKPDKELPLGSNTLKNTHWVFHNGLVYLFPKPVRADIKTGVAEGNWYSINKGEVDKNLQDNVFMLSLPHESTEKVSIDYGITACETSKEARLIYKKAKWKIGRNDSNCQSIEFADGLTMTAFYSPGGVKIKEKYVYVDTPCLLLFNDKTLIVRDPTNTINNMKITVEGVTKQISLTPYQSTSVFY